MLIRRTTSPFRVRYLALRFTCREWPGVGLVLENRVFSRFELNPVYDRIRFPTVQFARIIPNYFCDRSVGTVELEIRIVSMGISIRMQSPGSNSVMVARDVSSVKSTYRSYNSPRVRLGSTLALCWLKYRLAPEEAV